MAKQGEMQAVRVMAKDLVRTRRYVKKFIMMKANIQAVSLKITTLKSQGAMANAMKGVTKAMGAMNKQINMPQMQKIMMEFEKEVSVYILYILYCIVHYIVLRVSSSCVTPNLRVVLTARSKTILSDVLIPSLYRLI